MIYQKKVLDQYAIFQFVRIEFKDGRKFKGWLIPYSKKVKLLMQKCTKSKYIFLSSDGAIIACTRGCIKEIQYDFNGYTLPKDI